MKIYQSRIFEQKAKKLTKAQKIQLDEAVKSIVQNTSIGEKKKGDLRDVYVFKFLIAKQRYLLAYRFSDEAIELIMLGEHENYYRDLSSYLRKR